MSRHEFAGRGVLCTICGLARGAVAHYAVRRGHRKNWKPKPPNGGRSGASALALMKQDTTENER